MAVAAEELNDVLISNWEQLDGNQKEGVIEYIKYLLEEKHPISLDEYNKEIDEGLAEIEAGNFYTHEEVVKMLEEEIK
jgi:hypothetical protein